MSYFRKSPEIRESSPSWSSTTKLIVGLTLVAVLALLIFQLQVWIAPIMLSFIIAYLFHPLAAWLTKTIKVPWSLSVAMVYLLTVLVVLGLLTWGGFAIVTPIQNLIVFIQNTLNQIPEYVEQLRGFEISFGSFRFDASKLDLDNLVEQVANSIRPVVSQIGSWLGSFAAGAATTLGRILLLLLISFFILSETKGDHDKVININIPGYEEDLSRLGQELSRIWNAFLRGQLILVAVTFVIYTIVFSILGIKFVVALAFLAGLSHFVPFVGPWITWITFFLVAILQESTVFGLESWAYALIVVGLALIIDTAIDNLLAPRIFSEALHVHPAAVLVAILIAAEWLGLIGILLAAPVLATVKLFWIYIFNKLLDRDPWDFIKWGSASRSSLPRFSDIKNFAVKIWEKILGLFKNKQQTSKNSKKGQSE